MVVIIIHQMAAHSLSEVAIHIIIYNYSTISRESRGNTFSTSCPIQFQDIHESCSITFVENNVPPHDVTDLHFINFGSHQGEVG